MNENIFITKNHLVEQAFENLGTTSGLGKIDTYRPKRKF